MGKQPDQCELWAREYLIHLGFSAHDIVFQPDGQIPPDWLVEHRVAVEVRRLNQHIESVAHQEAIETLAEPLERRMRDLLRSLGPPRDGVSWYVDYRFRRPQLTKNWERIVRTRLLDIQTSPPDSETTAVLIDEHFGLTLTRAVGDHADCFVEAAVWDEDGDGGWVVPVLANNLEIVVAEKMAKTAPYRARYSEWWLILIDHIFGGGGYNNVSVPHDFERVIVIHPGAYSAAYELACTPPNTTGS